jgi:hypothetical protein
MSGIVLWRNLILTEHKCQKLRLSFRVSPLHYFLPSAHKKWGQFGCVFRGQKTRCFPSSFLIPLKHKKYSQFGRIFYVWDLIYTLYHFEHKKHGQIGCICLRLLSSPPPFSKIWPVWLCFCIWVLLHPCHCEHEKYGRIFVFYLRVFSLTPTQTRKTRPNWPHFSCLGSSLLPLKNSQKSQPKRPLFSCLSLGH